MSSLLNIFSKSNTSKETPTIIIDHREKNSLVISELINLGIKIEFKQLPIGDYLISDTIIERKTLADFKSSIINKRLSKQLLELKQYPSYFLILEGLESTDPYSGNLHENAFRGFLLSILTNYRVPIIFTLNEKDTAKYLSVLANKTPKSQSSLRPSKIMLSEKEQLQFVLEGFPNIGPIAAKKLLNEFRTLKNLANASEEELEKLICKKSENLYKIFNQEY